MVSHTSFGGIKLSVGAGGLRFKKRPSQFNIAIGKCMKGKPGPTNGGRYDVRFQNEFTQCARQASGRTPRRARAAPERAAK